MIVMYSFYININIVDIYFLTLEDLKSRSNFRKIEVSIVI